MGEGYDFVIVGSGPAGLGAAARAAEYDNDARQDNPGHQPTHILLEAFSSHAKTIHNYQKGKLVMDEPSYLDLRSPLEFNAGSREEVLTSWQAAIDTLGINIRFDAQVVGIQPADAGMTITLADGSSLFAKQVVLAIGLQGNPRPLGVEHDQSAFVQYTLEDPDEYHGETIVVVGAGDAAVENALALAKNNKVYIVNRRDEFSRVKAGNLEALLAEAGNPGSKFQIRYGTTVEAVVPPPTDSNMGKIILSVPEGEEEIECHRIIARLGAVPPRKLLDSFGIKFPNTNPTAVPELSATYESNIPGLYIIGALAGYPLIKQALNQGYDVIEYIKGNAVVPVDTALLERQFSLLPFAFDANQVVDMLKLRVPMFREMSMLSLRELLIESNIIVVLSGEEYAEAKSSVEGLQEQLRQQVAAQQLKQMPKLPQIRQVGDYIYREHDYTNTFFTVVDGQLSVEFPDSRLVGQDLGAGGFFGEDSLLSGRPRSESVIPRTDCILIETPRRVMLKLMNSSEPVREGIDWKFISRTLSRKFVPRLPAAEIEDIVARIEIRVFNAGEKLYREGDKGDCLYCIRSGAVTLSETSGDAEQALAQVQAGGIVGSLALMADEVRRESATAAVRVEALEIHRPEFIELLTRDASQVGSLQIQATEFMKEKARMESRPETGEKLSFLMRHGLGEATNAFIIDEGLCVGCDNCEAACAETHGGMSRLQREAGPSFNGLHISVSCRHCEIPHCMKDCPPDAIHRSPMGQVFIDDTCIGCGNCEANCPYDAISMCDPADHSAGLGGSLSGIFSLFGSKPVAASVDNGGNRLTKKAVKCDACMDIAGGPACVRACPTGAAFRINPDQLIEVADKA